MSYASLLHFAHKQLNTNTQISLDICGLEKENLFLLLNSFQNEHAIAIRNFYHQNILKFEINSKGLYWCSEADVRKVRFFVCCNSQFFLLLSEADVRKVRFFVCRKV